MTEKDNKDLNRTPRSADTRADKVARKPWSPPSTLDTPPAPEGYTYRWLRESMLGQEDRANVSRRIREGWELVRGTELPPEWRSLPTMDNGRHEGVVYNEGLLLAKIPNETVQERRDYYQGKSKEATEALDNNLFNETRSDSRYVKYDPQRDSNVTFGRK